MTFIRPFRSIIKNNITAFRDIGSSDIINVTIDYNNNYMSLKVEKSVAKSLYCETKNKIQKL